MQERRENCSEVAKCDRGVTLWQIIGCSDPEGNGPKAKRKTQERWWTGGEVPAMSGEASSASDWGNTCRGVQTEADEQLSDVRNALTCVRQCASVPIWLKIWTHSSCESAGQVHFPLKTHTHTQARTHTHAKIVSCLVSNVRAVLIFCSFQHKCQLTLWSAVSWQTCGHQLTLVIRCFTTALGIVFPLSCLSSLLLSFTIIFLLWFLLKSINWAAGNLFASSVLCFRCNSCWI